VTSGPERRKPGPQFAAILIAVGAFAIFMGIWVWSGAGGRNPDTGSFKVIAGGAFNVAIGVFAALMGLRILLRARRR
jgi:hypothetical protein